MRKQSLWHLDSRKSHKFEKNHCSNMDQARWIGGDHHARIMIDTKH